jgi:hypothetical protein
MTILYFDTIIKIRLQDNKPKELDLYFDRLMYRDFIQFVKDTAPSSVVGPNKFCYADFTFNIYLIA